MNVYNYNTKWGIIPHYFCIIINLLKIKCKINRYNNTLINLKHVEMQNESFTFLEEIEL